MAKILNNQWNVFSDGDVSDAEKVSDNIYKPSTSYGSLEHINGHLDQQNLPVATDSTFWTIGSEVVQDNTFTGGSMVGATRNMDFFRNPLFIDAWRENIYGPDPTLDASGEENKVGPGASGLIVADDEDFVVIPGASISFYLPYDCTLVLFTWNIQFDDDGDQGPNADRTHFHPLSEQSGTTNLTRSWVRFYLDDAWVQGQERITYPTKLIATKDTSEKWLPGGDPRGPRYWNGHHAAAVSNGAFKRPALSKPEGLF